MGLLDTIKGWFNIGGVKVRLAEAPSQLSKSGNEFTEKVELTSKSDKYVLKLTYQLVEAHTTGRDDDEKTKETVLGEMVVDEEFDIKAGETKALDFQVAYAIPERMRDKGGVLGAAAKFGAMAGAEKLEYEIVAVCDVKGTALDPSAKKKVVLID